MKNENFLNYKRYTSVASTNDFLIITPKMKSEQVLTVTEIVNEISTIEKKIKYLENIKVCEVQLWYNQDKLREFIVLPQNKIPFSLSVEIQKLISDSIKFYNTKLLNLFQILNQKK